MISFFELGGATFWFCECSLEARRRLCDRAFFERSKDWRILMAIGNVMPVQYFRKFQVHSRRRLITFANVSDAAMGKTL